MATSPNQFGFDRKEKTGKEDIKLQFEEEYFTKNEKMATNPN